MRVHKWFVRSIAFGLLLTLVSAGILYARWTNSAVVRRQVIEHLQTQLPAAHVTLEGAALRILGGLTLTDLRLTRRDDDSRQDFLHVPSAVVYHDKEKLLDGVVAFRKIELYRPRLRIVRRTDGSWNLSALVSSAPSSNPLSTLVIHEGTLIFLDQSAGGLPPIEITGLDLAIVNDPIQVVRFEGKGKSEVFGAVQIKGAWQRDCEHVQLSIQTSRGEITDRFFGQWVKLQPQSGLKGLTFRSKVDATVEFEWAPTSGKPPHYDIRCRLYEGACRHAMLPFPLEKLTANARCTNGHLTIEKLTAASGTMEISAHGVAGLEDLQNNFKGAVTVRQLVLCPDFCKRLPVELHELNRLFNPQGVVSLRLEADRNQGKWRRCVCRLNPDKIKVRFVHFPYDVADITGSIDVDLLRQSAQVDLQSLSGNRLIKLTGMWAGIGQDANVHLDVLAKGIALDQKLIDALPASNRTFAKSFHPRGFCDVRSVIKHGPESTEFECRHLVHFYESSVKWDQFPYELQRIRGELHIHPDGWECKDFHGYHGKGEVYVRGHACAIDANSIGTLQHRMVIDIAGRNIEIDGDLRAALAPRPGLLKVWHSLSPAGRLNFASRVDRLPELDEDLDVTVELRGCSIDPVYFPYPLHDLSGFCRYSGNRLELYDLRARHNLSNFRIAKGKVDLSEGGGFYADLEGVAAKPVYPGDGFFAAMPKPLRDAISFLDPGKPIAVQSRMIIAKKEDAGSAPDFWWDGLVWMRDAKLNLGVEVEKVTGVVACVGRYNGRRLQGLKGHAVLNSASLFRQRFNDVHARLQVSEQMPDKMLVGIKAPVYGGDVTGQIRLDMSSTMQYELNLTASQVNLEKFGRDNFGEKSQLKGLASARLHLTGEGTDPQTLDGNGNINIPRGKLLNLPLLLDLLKFLGLRWPDQTAFEEAHADFSIRGHRLGIKRLDLWGNAISLVGQGELNLDGSDVNLDFYPTWARVEQLLPPALRELSPAMSKNLMKIQARGKIGAGKDDLRFHKRPVPVLTEPLIRLHRQIVDTEKKQRESFLMKLRRSR